jgi:cytochrome c oxidase cbb3-type subunit 4
MHDMYTILTQFAHSWALLGMTLFFLAVVVWVFLPFNRSAHEDAARSIFRNDRTPAPEDSAPGDGQGA